MVMFGTSRWSFSIRLLGNALALIKLMTEMLSYEIDGRDGED